MKFQSINCFLKLILFSMITLAMLFWHFNSLNQMPRSTLISISTALTNETKTIPLSRNINLTKNYPKYYEDDLHPSWVFNISRTYDEQHLYYWTEPIRNVPKSQQWNQDENGRGFVPKNIEDAAEMRKLLDKHNYNLYASERISLRRSLPDHRYPECRNLTYPDRLPNISVVIVMHNEAWSMILRTIWSIIDRSPPELLHEIIIVDDASTWDNVKRPLDDYVEMLPARIRILRSTQRIGLIRARLIGARHATASILIFLDAHSECTQGWLQPIVARIANDRSVVAIPLIHSIRSSDLSFTATYHTRINMLRWYLLFNWKFVPRRELIRTKHDRTAPIRTPTHVGCAFAIDREFFFEIGSYDTGMDIWGSENVELAFRVWMCGGSLEVLGCSRVGHLFRKSTYSFNDDRIKIETRNNNRLIEVWMDEYKNFIYAAFPKSKEVSPGDLTERKQLRERLKCKSFRWYLEHIFPESIWLKEFIIVGEIKSVSKKMCLDAGSSSSNGRLMLWSCHGLGQNQMLALSKSGQFVTAEELCIGINSLKQAVIVGCSDSDKTQLWTHNEEHQWIVHRDTGLCMQSDENAVILDTCDSTDKRFSWKYESTIPAN